MDFSRSFCAGCAGDQGQRVRINATATCGTPVAVVPAARPPYHGRQISAVMVQSVAQVRFAKALHGPPEGRFQPATSKTCGRPAP